MTTSRTIAIIGALHGDEKVGIEVINGLEKIVDGKKIAGIVANERALKKDIRFIDQDLNRSFPGNKDGNYEENLAYEVLKKVKKFDYVLDLHSFSCQSDPFVVLSKKTARHFMMARASGIDKVVLVSFKVASGRALIDHCPCGISIESGRHNLKSTFRKAEACTKNILIKLGFLEGKRKRAARIDYYKIVDVFFKRNNKEKLIDSVVNFKLVRKGEVIANGGKKKFIAPYDFYPILAREVAYPKIFCLAAKSVKIKKR